MNDCARIVPLLEVYLDDETTPETNVLLHRHLEQCPSCTARLHAARELRDTMRAALRQDHAPQSLRDRVRAAMAPEPRPALASFLRSWVVPAAATAIVAWIVLPWRPAEPGVYTAIALAEHRACALERAVPVRGVGVYQPAASMPLVPNAGGKVRVIDAHACGQSMDFLHVVLEEGGTKASILISRAGEGGERSFPAERHRDFEVTGVRTTRHRAWLVVDRAHARGLRAWRGEAMLHVQRFMKQLEGL
jgi:mycothiol system anti-sigma-R factor